MPLVEVGAYDCCLSGRLKTETTSFLEISISKKTTTANLNYNLYLLNLLKW